MNNPMRDVIEQMKDAAQREGKQQTSPVAKAAMERRRLVEKLTMANLDTKSAHKNLVDADLWADKEQAPKVEALYRQAERLQKQISALLAEVSKQGE